MTFQFRGLYFEDYEVEDELFTATRTITEADTVNFAGISGDFNPLHTDEEFAKTTPHESRIAHGMLTLSVASGLVNQLRIFEGTVLALKEVNNRFTGAVHFGDSIKVKLTVLEKKDLRRQPMGLVKLKTEITNQKDELVGRGVWTLLVKKGEE